MSIGSEDMAEEIMPYLGLDKITWFRFHAAAPWMPRLLAAGCAAAVSQATHNQ